MQNPKTKIIAALKSALPDIPISAAWHNEKLSYPQITVTQVTNRPAVYADDTPFNREALIQIDIWVQGNPFELSRQVQEALAAINYYAADEREMNEQDINRVLLEYYFTF